MKRDCTGVCRIAVAMAICALFGCEKKSGEREIPLSVVAGQEITVADVSNTVVVVGRIQELAKRPIRENLFPQWANSYSLKLAPGLMQAALLERAVRDRGVKPTAASDAATLAKYNRMTRQKAANLDVLAPLFGDQAETFRRQFARESVFEAFYLGNGCDIVTEKDVTAYYRAQTNLLNRCRKVTERGWAKGRAAHAKLKAGEPWESIAKDYSEDGDIEPTNADNWKEWIILPIGKIDSKNLADAVAKLEVGGFTEPVDIDEGLVIVKLNAKDGENLELARILIRLGCEMEIPDREEAERQIRANKRAELQRKVLEEAHTKYKVEYPRGTNFVLKIWNVPETKPRKARVK